MKQSTPLLKHLPTNKVWEDGSADFEARGDRLISLLRGQDAAFSTGRILQEQRHHSDGTLAVLMIVFALFCFIWYVLDLLVLGWLGWFGASFVSNGLIYSLDVN